MMWSSLFSIISSGVIKHVKNAFEYLTNNPKVLVGVLFLCLLFFAGFQYKKNQDLKRELIEQKKLYERDTTRFNNNILALNDSVVYHRDQGMLLKRILEVTDNEKRLLSNDLQSTYSKLDSVLTLISEQDVDIESIYIAEFNGKIVSDSANTTVDTKNDTLHIALSDSNQIFTLNTDTFLELKPDTNQRIIDVDLTDYFGIRKPTRIQYDFNFRVSMSKYRTEDNAQRVSLQFLDKSGLPIQSEFLETVLIEGASFIDVKPTNIYSDSNKRKKWGVTVGPTLMFDPNRTVFTPGIGVTVGYHIF